MFPPWLFDLIPNYGGGNEDDYSQGYILSPCLFHLYAEYIMQNARINEAQAGIKIVRRNIIIIAKFRLKLKKVRKTTRSFRCDVNQISYDYKVEVMNRLKGLDLVDRVPEELWTEVCNTDSCTVLQTSVQSA